MATSRVYFAKNPICRKGSDDPRIKKFRMLDGRQQALQNRRLEELAEEGRQTWCNAANRPWRPNFWEWSAGLNWGRHVRKNPVGAWWWEPFHVTFSAYCTLSRSNHSSHSLASIVGSALTAVPTGAIASWLEINIWFVYWLRVQLIELNLTMRWQTATWRFNAFEWHHRGLRVNKRSKTSSVQLSSAVTCNGPLLPQQSNVICWGTTGKCDLNIFEQTFQRVLFLLNHTIPDGTVFSEQCDHPKSCEIFAVGSSTAPLELRTPLGLSWRTSWASWSRAASLATWRQRLKNRHVVHVVWFDMFRPSNDLWRFCILWCMLMYLIIDRFISVGFWTPASMMCSFFSKLWDSFRCLIHHQTSNVAMIFGATWTASLHDVKGQKWGWTSGLCVLRCFKIFEVVIAET